MKNTTNVAEMWDALLGTDMAAGMAQEVAAPVVAVRGATYVVYEIESTRIQILSRDAFGRGCHRTDTVSLPYAKRVAARMGAKYAVAEIGHFRAKIEKMVTVRNLMSGKPVQQPVNTPRSCDVSSELYWSM